MPELPEVETINRGMKKYLLGKVIVKVEVDWFKSLAYDQEFIKKHLLNATIKSIDRRGKVLILSLNNNFNLLFHLKMTGQLVYVSKNEKFGAGHPSDSLVNKLPDKSTRIIFYFKDDSKLFFNDQRKFGWAKILDSKNLKEFEFLKKLGPEPLEKDFTLKVFKERLNFRKNSKIKAALLDQTIIAGLGNIYTDESLWMAKIHPSEPVYKLTDIKIKKLYDSILEILNLSIQKGGSSDRNYINIEGKKGSYIEFANVYKKVNQNCKRCGSKIIRIKVASRGTHLCPKCQKLLK